VTRRKPATPRLLALKLPDDPEAAFRVRMAADRAELQRLMKRRPGVTTFAALEELAHGLAGSAGVFGYHEIGEVAALLERLAERYRRLRPATLSPRRKALLVNATTALLAALDAGQRTGVSTTSL
jgi:HPt (histidine-containing phosphotransfer) domain-containing protein